MIFCLTIGPWFGKRKGPPFGRLRELFDKWRQWQSVARRPRAACGERAKDGMARVMSRCAAWRRAARTRFGDMSRWFAASRDIPRSDRVDRFDVEPVKPVDLADFVAAGADVERADDAHDLAVVMH